MAAAIFNGNFVKLLKNALRLGSRSSDPSGAAAGDVYYNSTDSVLKFYTGSVWTNAASVAVNSLYAVENYTLAASVSGNALTISLKDFTGSDPSSTSVVRLPIRNATATSGGYSILSVNSATSLTISSGSTLGATSATAFKVWIVAFNDGGTVRLGAINCLSGANATGFSVYPLGQFPIASSTAEGGAGAADSAHVFYTGTAVTSKPYLVLGYLSYETGLTTAGTWDATPSRIQLHQPGMPLPGVKIQSARDRDIQVATGTATIPADDTIPQNTEGTEFLNKSITPTSAANLLHITSHINGSHSANGYTAYMALFKDSIANAQATANLGSWGGSTFRNHGYLAFHDLAGSTSSITYKIRAGANEAGTFTFNGQSGSREMGGTLDSYLEIDEIMT